MEHHSAPIVVVTGAAAGLGLEMVRELIARGFTVCGIDFNATAMASLASSLGSAYHGFVGDVSDDHFTLSSVAAIEAIGHVSLLINNAGQPSFKSPTDYSSADVERCLTGLRGMIAWTTAILKATHERDVKIVNVMSSAALRGNPHESVYCAAKWGERGYTESLKAAYKGSSVKVMGFYPGGIDTDFYTDSRDYVDIEKQRSFMNPKDVAHMLLENALSTADLTVADLVIERNSQRPFMAQGQTFTNTV
ncbi:SDR family NAD(P)-dependent oxidoreductase [Bifidobacterium sp.]|uniref:SDR family NAD(P)-dependent oxidoreductase n=1 Tax=Bifidobacterium sp. TaxID=41200 RepID=UPI0039EBD850